MLARSDPIKLQKLHFKTVHLDVISLQYKLGATFQLRQVVVWQIPIYIKASKKIIVENMP